MLGAILFCIAIHPILLRARARFKAVKIMAIMDDINFWGPTEDVLDAYEFMAGELATLRLIANEKTTLHPPAAEHLTDAVAERIAVLEGAKLITVDRLGVKIVGTMRSRDEDHVRKFLDDKVHKGANLFRRMAMLPPMQAYTVLQKCGAPRATYLIRTHNPKLTENYTADFDRNTQVVLEHVVRHTLDGASRETEILAHLPPSDGGKGITRTSWIREAAFKASSEACRAAATNGPATTTQETAVEMFNKGLIAELDGMGKTQKAHRLASSEKNSSLWASALTCQYPPLEYCARMQFALAIPGDDVAPYSTCPGCKKVFGRRDFLEHTPGCALLKGENCTTAHHSVNKCFQDCAIRACVGYQNEPRDDLYGTTIPLGDDRDHEDYHQKGPDLRLHLPRSLVIDLKGVNMSCLTHAGKKPTTVERVKELASRKLYEAACDGERFEVPCFHVCGRMNKAFTDVIRELVDERPETMEYKAELVKFSVAIARGVGRTLLTVMKARRYAGPQPRAKAQLDGKVVIRPGASGTETATTATTAAARNGSDGDAATAITAPAVARSDGGFGHTRPGGANAGTSGAGDGV